MEQISLFDNRDTAAPLASRLRPDSLENYVGQKHLIGKGKILRRLIESDQISSMIFWGPPGVGKTTLARIIAEKTRAEFVEYSAVNSTIKEIKDVMTRAEENRRMGIRTLLFADEIHRFNKAQQDAFLPFVEKGSIILIGATTENPSFEINSALLSRCKVFILKALGEEDLTELLHYALKSPKGLGNMKISIEDTHLSAIARFANGDARTALNTLEMAVFNGRMNEQAILCVDEEVLAQCMNRRSLLYDKNGEEHYNLISALHKSMRNSDPDAAVYYLALMLEAGEDIKFIARRILVHAAEDVGLADPQALVVASAAATAVQFVGMPEARIILSEAVLYIATAPKSNAAVEAIRKAQELARTEPIDIPPYLQDAHYKGAGKLGRGIGYKYPHDYPGHYVEQQYLPNSLTGTNIYTPGDFGREREFKEWKQGPGVWGSTGKTAVQARAQAPGTAPQAMETFQAPPSAPPSPFT